MHEQISTPRIRVLAIPGSLRTDSLNMQLLRIVQQLAPAGMDIEIYDGAGLLPMYNEDLDGPSLPDTVADLRARIDAADALFWATPEFNHTIPAVVKNVVEWVSHPLSQAQLVGKVSAIAVATQGRGGYRGMADLARVLRDLGGHVVVAPEVCLHFAHKMLNETATGEIELQDTLARSLLQRLLDGLAVAVRNHAGTHSGAPWRAIFAGPVA